MAVTEYKPKKDLGCRYSYDKLENVVYLVSEEHLKEVFIDNGEAYISGLTETPIRLEGFNINFTEESSLDERYKFTKQVTFSLHGYVSPDTFEGKYYVILKSKDGTKWMVNVDFPSKVTYTFNLDASQYQTDFTFASVSNFPTLRLATAIDDGTSPCKQLRIPGIESLRLLETDYCKLNSASGVVYTYGKDFVDVEFLGQSCSLQESFDGERLTTTIQFDIAFDSYKSSWHYNLLEFLQNRYSAIIRPKGGDNTFFSGFNFGLEPSFNVSTTSLNGQSDIITVTLIEAGSEGSYNTTDWSQQEETGTTWVYVKKVGNYLGYECIGLGRARYLLKQEINLYGQPTGRYLVLQGYASYYPNLNIVGTFSTTEEFNEPTCTGAMCEVNTNLPTSITYREQTCYTYSYSASCDWNVSGLATYMTVTPSSGVAGTQYSLSVCNTKTPTTNESSTFKVTAGDNVTIVNVNLTTDTSILNPASVNIDCLAQEVRFNFNANCPITVTSIDSRLTYTLTSSQLIVNVPRNYSVESGITWSIGVKDCQNHTQTVTIIQDKTYERWVDSTDYICVSGDSYVKQLRYTGTTSTNTNTPTGESRAGSLIQSGDTRCIVVQTRWVTSQYYYCIEGNKWSFDEQEESTDGVTWVKNGNTRLGAMVESASSFCEQSVEYKWELTSRWQCGYEPKPYSEKYLTFVAEEYGVFSFSGTSGNSVQYSLDGGYNWAWLTNGYSTPSVASGATVMWKGNMSVPSNANGIGKFSASGRFIVEGNSMSLLYDDDFDDKTSLRSSKMFMYLFSGCTGMTSAGNMILPATTVTDFCYYGMFAGCTNLTTAPELPAMAMKNQCYNGMFMSCTSLTTAPDLPATTLANYCYDNMFTNCTSLTTAPSVLPATTLADYCYYRMFYDCTSLTTAPEIPATTLAPYCCEYMFDSCSGLTTAPSTLPATTLANYCYSHMFYDCTSLTTAPSVLPATTLAPYCYQYMFIGCTSLTRAPELPAATLVEGCYRLMLYYCLSLNYIKCLATDISATDCTLAWTESVSSTGTFVKASSMSSWPTGNSGIPSNWTVQDA